MSRIRFLSVATIIAFGAAAHAAEGASDGPPTVWNPVVAGPELLSGVGLQPPGQMFLRLYGFSEIGYAQYGSGWAARTEALDQGVVALNPNVEFAYGILPWFEAGLFTSEASWWQAAGGGAGVAFGNGVGDTNPYFKIRLHSPQQGGLPLWLTEMVFVSLPTSRWAGPMGTPSIPGGFAPLGRLPATHFGEPEVTELLLARKTFRPFRVEAGVYYSYALPGSGNAGNGVGQDFGDIFQYRFAFEQVLDDKSGLAYALEGIGLQGLPFRIDGQPVNAGRSSFGLLGAQPTIEYNITSHVAAEAGVLFTAAGMNDIAAVYPNLSIYYFWSPSGVVGGR